MFDYVGWLAFIKQHCWFLKGKTKLLHIPFLKEQLPFANLDKHLLLINSSFADA